MYLACEARWTTGAVPARSLRWFVLAGGMILFGVLLAIYNRSGQSPFTEGNAGTYKRDFSPLSIYHTYAAYLFMSPVASMATALQASMLIWNLIVPAPVRWSRLVFVQVLILLFALPYCVLPQHTALYYVFNWTVWQIGGPLRCLWGASGRVAVRWAVALIAVVCVAVGQPGRRSISEWYAKEGLVNRNIVAALRNNADALRPYRAVAIEGAPFLSPFESDGRFLSMRYGLDHDWILSRIRDSETYRTAQLLGVQILGRVRTVATEEVPRPVGVPILRLSPDGTGMLDLPSVAIKESDRSESRESIRTQPMRA